VLKPLLFALAEGGQRELAGMKGVILITMALNGGLARGGNWANESVYGTLDHTT